MEREQTALDDGARAYGTVRVDVFINCPHDSLDCECSNAYDELWGEIEDLIIDNAIGQKLTALGATHWVR